MDAIDELLAKLKPETRAMFVRASEVEPPVYATEEDEMQARQR
ncbi:MAG: hypothetical protein QM747_03775 [Nocardioides sp.]